MYTLLAHAGNYQKIERKKNDIKYLVIHYTANDGDTARGNLRYFASKAVSASAHFFVDAKEVCCSVPWYFRAWHCGSKNGYKHVECRNSNSIGIELCSRKTENGKYYFLPETVERAAEFVAQQMKNFEIPIDRVVRHYDVTGKHCPAPYVDFFAWHEFKRKVMEYYSAKVGEKVAYYEKLEDIPAGVKRDTVKKLVERGTIKGTMDGGLHLSDDMVRMLVFNDREGLYK